MWNRSKKRINRRVFLSRSACVSAAVATTPSLLRHAAADASEESRWTMRLSTSSLQFSSLSVEKACEQIAALGFDAIDFWPSNFDCPHLDEIEKRLGPKGLAELLAQHKLKLYAFSCYSRGYRRYAELLGKAGGGVAIRESRYGKAGDLTAEMKTLMEQLKPQVDMAEKHNSYIAIENHGNSLLHSFDSFKAFVQLNRSPRLGIALAPYHLQIAGVSVEEVIGIVKEQLFFFYAWQHAGDLNQLPGVGPTDFTPWIAALAKVNYRWYVNPFMHGHPAADVMAKSLAISRKYLKKCYAKAVLR
jgi:sugar phosphate isomerase/epimerase